RDLVFLAYLLGSDYTVGIRGIGPVLAMEVLAEFGPAATAAGAGAAAGAAAGAGAGAAAAAADSGAGDDEAQVLDALRAFGQWCRAVSDVVPGIEVPGDLVGTPLRRRLAQVVRKTSIPASFPDARVAHAYFHPQVDGSSEAAFAWGFPKLDLLRQFLGEKLGWAAEKTNETLLPLVRKMAEDKDAGARGSMDAAGLGLGGAAAPASHHSRRVGRAISSHRSHAANRTPDAPGTQPRDAAKAPLASRRSLI
ncbi:DNA repair protein rad2, partial [Kickxella alabastrina]